MTNNESMGTVTISRRALAEIAARIAADCEGVEALADRSRREEVSRLIGGGVKGAYVTKVKGGVAVDIYIVCRHGSNIPRIRKRIADGIRDTLGGAGVGIKSVSVTAAGILPPKGARQ